MNKPDLAAAVLRNLSDDPTNDAKKIPGIGMMKTILDTLLYTIEAVTKTEEVRIRDFGTFRRATTAARTMPNVLKRGEGDTINVPAKSRLVFKCSSNLVETVDG